VEGGAATLFLELCGRLVVLESGLGLKSGSPFLLDLDLDLKAVDLDSDLEVLSAGQFFKSFVPTK